MKSQTASTKIFAAKLLVSVFLLSSVCAVAAVNRVSGSSVDVTLGNQSAQSQPIVLRHTVAGARASMPAASMRTHTLLPKGVPTWLEQKVVASDGRPLDQLGWTVALDGNTALVGARTCFCNGSQPDRSVLVFTDSGGVWTQTQEITVPDAPPDAGFGWSVALDGSTAVIGAVSAGVAYVFTDTGGSWTQTQELQPDDPDASFFFGAAVAIEGNRILVGSPFQSKTFVYEFDVSNDLWVRTSTLTPADGTPGDQFGVTVALDGSTALVGAFGATVNANTEQGAAYMFEETGGTWGQTQELTSSDGVAGDWFGSSVALNGDVAMVGARQADTEPPFTDQGAAYVFNRAGGIWTEGQKLVVPIPGGGGGFGTSIAIDGTEAVISASNAVLVGNTFEGAAYVFNYSAGIWSETQQLVASDGTPDDWFGWGFSSVALENGVVLIGAYNAAVEGQAQRGAAYFYHQSGAVNDGIFCNGFELGEDGSCGASAPRR